MTAWFSVYPHLGGGRGTYLPVLAELRRVATCHVPTLPGRDGRYGEPAHRTFASLGDDLWQQLRVELDAGADPGELVLFGFSMGALLATELAARLAEQGTGCRGLVVAGSPPPHLLDAVERIGDLPDDEFVAALARHGVMAQTVLPEAELRELMLPIWRADCAVVESHPRARVRLSCPVLAVAGSADPLVDAAQLAAWQQVGGPGSRFLTVPGGHGAVLENHGVLLELLTEAAGVDLRASR
ncbi:medium-chain acyl-[acyl-carrier-protein] hydrolase [Micromonospora nigra]|uniref:Medium-chain acyl-[acyl-carrier-protein] hydrolase n=1 Tax=Micromonospora nigra TaxID=145857 RepID=A0A1C6RC82_9ACTN|nr:alpha/beta fold hydrolase [Micromonospora nigra]SCL14592.1 medium-chain acyl-[acyl-carrier-protein] hydrolase [Micromonospora nigra]